MDILRKDSAKLKEEFVKEKESLCKKLADEEQRNIKLQQDYEDLKAADKEKLAKLGSELKETQDELALISTDMEKIKVQLLQTQQSCLESEAILSKLTARESELLIENNNLKTLSKKAEEEYLKEKESFNHELEAEKMHNVTLQQDYERLKSANIDNLAKLESKLKETLEESERVKTEYSAHLEELQVQLSQSQKSYSEKELLYSILTARESELLDEVNNLKTASNKLEEEHLKKTVLLNEKLEFEEQQKVKLQQVYNELKAADEDMLAKLNSELKETQDHLERVEMEYSVKLDELNIQLLQVQQNLQEKEATVNKLTVKENELLDELNSLRNSSKILEEDYLIKTESFIKELEEVQQQKIKLSQDYEELKSANEETVLKLESKLEETQNELVRVETTYSTNMEQLKMQLMLVQQCLLEKESVLKDLAARQGELLSEMANMQTAIKTREEENLKDKELFFKELEDERQLKMKLKVDYDILKSVNEEKLTKLESELKQRETELVKVETEYSTSMEELKVQLLQAQESYVEIEATLNKLIVRESELLDENNNLKTLIRKTAEEYLNEKESFNEKLDFEKKQKAELQHVYEELKSANKDRLTELESKLEETQEELVRVKTEYSISLEEQKRQLSQVQQSLLEKETALNVLTAKENKLLNEVESLKSSEKEYLKEKESLNKKLEIEELQNVKLQQDYDELKISDKGLLEMLERKLKEVQIELNVIQNAKKDQCNKEVQCELFNQELAEEQQLRKNWQLECEEMQSKLGLMDTKMAEREQQLYQLQVEKQAAEDLAVEKNECINRLISERQLMEENLNKINERNTILKEMLASESELKRHTEFELKKQMKELEETFEMREDMVKRQKVLDEKFNEKSELLERALLTVSELEQDKLKMQNYIDSKLVVVEQFMLDLENWKLKALDAQQKYEETEIRLKEADLENSIAQKNMQLLLENIDKLKSELSFTVQSKESTERNSIQLEQTAQQLRRKLFQAENELEATSNELTMAMKELESRARREHDFAQQLRDANETNKLLKDKLMLKQMEHQKTANEVDKMREDIDVLMRYQGRQESSAKGLSSNSSSSSSHTVQNRGFMRPADSYADIEIPVSRKSASSVQVKDVYLNECFFVMMMLQLVRLMILLLTNLMMVLLTNLKILLLTKLMMLITLVMFLLTTMIYFHMCH